MNDEQRSSQVSALFDGELPEAEQELVVRRVLKDPLLADSWSRYAAIGAVLRDEPLVRAARTTPDIAARVMAQLADEPQHAGEGTVPAAASGGRAWFARGAAGAAIAAGVAAVSLMVLRAQAPLPNGVPDTMTAVAAPETTAPVAGSVPAPPVAAPARQLVAVARPAAAESGNVDLSPVGDAVSAPLVGYVVAHSEYATPAVRFSPLSTVMMVDVDPTIGTVETTEAEARDRR